MNTDPATYRAQVFAERLALLQAETNTAAALLVFADLVRVVFATPGCERESLRAGDLPRLAQIVYDLGERVEALRVRLDAVETERNEARDALRAATEPTPDDRLGWRIVNAFTDPPDNAPDLLREAWTAFRKRRADAATKAATIAAQDEEIAELSAERDKLRTTIVSNAELFRVAFDQERAETFQALAELRLTLAAEQGRQEGAPSARWRWQRERWEALDDDARVVAIAERGGRLQTRETDEGLTVWPRSEHDTASAAMIAADATTTTTTQPGHDEEVP